MLSFEQVAASCRDSNGMPPTLDSGQLPSSYRILTATPGYCSTESMEMPRKLDEVQALRTDDGIGLGGAFGLNVRIGRLKDRSRC